MQRFQEVLKQRTRWVTVIAEDVYHLHNASAIVRSCEAFGIQDVHVIEEKLGKRIDKEIALGAQKWTSIKKYNSTKKCITHLKQQGYAIVATTLDNEAFTPNNLPIDTPMAIVFGTEKDGVSNTVSKQADYKLSIPMYGFTESLNVSVAAAIILQTLSIRLRASKLSWQLSSDEITMLFQDWVKQSVKDWRKILAHYQKKNVN